MAEAETTIERSRSPEAVSVLLATPDAAEAEELSRVLEGADQRVVVARDGKHAFELASTMTRLDVIVADGGVLAGMVDVCLRVSASTLSARIQETHILIGHVICELVDEQLFPPVR